MDSPPQRVSGSPSPGAGGAAVASAPPRIPGHTLHRRIGAGSYGEVWLAQNVLGEWRAVKIVRRDKFEEERPYQREFEGLSHYAPISLSHPSLLRVLQVERDDAAGYFYCVMELADDATPLAGSKFQVPSSKSEGTGVAEAVASFDPETYKPKTLREVLRERSRLPLEECLSIGLELVTALEALHARGLVHRDVKPSNIVFIRGEAKLADIGLVAKYENTLSLVGADGYMPPLGASTPQADLFALGKVIYEMSTGLDRLQCPRLPNLKNLPARDRKGILELNRVILKACGSSPKSRYQSATGLKVDLMTLQEGTSLQLRRQFKIAVVLFAVILFALLTTLVVQKVWSRSREEARQRELFIRQAQAARPGASSIRHNGWFTNNWDLLGRAARLRWDDDLAEQATAAMAGEDVRVVSVFTGIGGSSLAFDGSGKLLIGGLSNAPARSWDLQTPTQVTSLATSNEGPICINASGEPRQFCPQQSNRFVLREVSTGMVLREFDLPGDPAIGDNGHPILALSTDGSCVAAVVKLPDGTGRLAVWEAATGKLLLRRDEAVTALAFSPDGAYLARGRVGRLLIISRVSEPDSETTIRTGRGTVHCLAFAPDLLEDEQPVALPNKRWLLAAGTSGGTITIYEAATGQIRSICRGSHYDVFALAFHPNGTLIASAGRGPLNLWDVDSGRQLLSLEANGHPTDFPRGLAFSQDGRHLAVITEKVFSGPLLAVWEVQTGHGIDTLRGLSAQVSRVWWSADRKKLAGLSHNWELAVWDVPTGKLLRIFAVPEGGSADNAAVAFSPDGRQTAFAAGGAARLYDLESGTMLRSWALPYGFADQVRFLDDAHLILLRREHGAGGGSRVTWRARNLLLPGTNSLQPVFEQQETNWITYNTASAPNGDYFVVSGRRMGTNLNGIYRVISCRDGRQLLEIPTQTEMKICWPALDPNGRFLPCPPDARGRMRVLRLPGGDLVDEVDHQPDGAGPLQAIGPTGTLFAGKLERGGCQLFDSSRKDHALRLGMDSRMVLGPEFSPDGSRLAWGTEDGTVLVAELDEVRRRLRQLQTSR